MSSQQEREELDRRTREGETIVPGGTGGEAQEHLAEGKNKGGGQEQLRTEGYKEIGRKDGPSTGDESGQEYAEKEGIEIDESKFKTTT